MPVKNNYEYSWHGIDKNKEISFYDYDFVCRRTSKHVNEVIFKDNESCYLFEITNEEILEFAESYERSELFELEMDEWKKQSLVKRLYEIYVYCGFDELMGDEYQSMTLKETTVKLQIRYDDQFLESN